MATHADSSGLDSLLRVLVSYRLAVYIGGLAAISVPAVLRATVGIDPPSTVRTIIVGASLGLMILTYLGELRLGHGSTGPAAGRPRTEPTTGDTIGESESDATGYSKRTRTTVVIGLVGIVVGIYVVIEINTFVGMLFIVGGLLFGRSAYRDHTEGP